MLNFALISICIFMSSFWLMFINFLWQMRYNCSCFRCPYNVQCVPPNTDANQWKCQKQKCYNSFYEVAFKPSSCLSIFFSHTYIYIYIYSECSIIQHPLSQLIRCQDYEMSVYRVSDYRAFTTYLIWLINIFPRTTNFTK